MTRKTIPIAAAVAALLLWNPGWIAGPVAAQAPAALPAPLAREAMQAQAQKLWDGYRTGRGGQDALARIASARALPATRENVAALFALLRSNVGSAEKVLLARIAGDLHRGLGGDAHAQSQIERQLSGFARAADDPALSRAAVLAHARLGYFPDSMALLAYAHSRGFIGDDDYYVEIAHLVAFAPAADQARLLNELQAGNNGHAQQVLANSLKDDTVLRGLGPEATVAALGALGKEPSFPDPEPALGAAGLSRYESWLWASVALTSQASREPARVVMARMLQAEGDPRKLIAALSTGRSSALVRSAMDSRSLDEIDAAIAAYAAAHIGSHPAIQEFAAIARANLGGPGRLLPGGK